jgi:hypothetical protein
VKEEKGKSMTLISEYFKHGPRNHKHSVPDTERRTQESRVCEFLIYCMALNVPRIQAIEQKHLAGFLNELRHRNLSDWTIYKYGLTLRTFAKRRGVSIKIRPTLPATKERRPKRACVFSANTPA